MTFGMSLTGLIPFAFERASAQASTSASTVSIELGAMTIAQARGATVSAGIATLAAQRATTHTALSASALALRSSANQTGLQGTLGAQLALPKYPSLQLEVSGSATEFGALSSNYGSSRDGFVRPQFARANYGVFATLGAGRVRRDGSRFHSRSWDTGAWAQHGALGGLLSARRSFTNDYDLMEAAGFPLSRPAQHYAVQDILASFSTRASQFELLITGANREGLGATSGRSNALYAALTTTLTRRFSLIVNGGKQLAEPLSGVPQANVAGVTLRVHLASGTRVSPRDNAVPVAVGATTQAGTRVTPHASGGATVVIRVDAPASAAVEITGTFNDWSILRMTRDSTMFESSIELTKGAHRIAVRINGGDWKAPPGLARVKDDLGGEAGIVVVP